MHRRLPWLTIAVFILTAGITATMLVWPPIGTALERDPVMLGQGQIWRFVTTWLVQTDGWKQIGINSAGLLIYGALVETRVGRFWWAIGYVAAGLAGEVAGIFWQPVGGGNSVAICGLIGVYSVWQVRQSTLGVQRFLGGAIWAGIGLWLTSRADIHGQALIMGFVIGLLAQALPQSGREPSHA